MGRTAMDLTDLDIIDAHIHQWDPRTTPREFSKLATLLRYLPLSIDIAAKLAPRRDREFVGDPTAYTGPYLPADYRTDLGTTAVRGIGHCEVEWTGWKPDETRWVASLPFGVDTPPLSLIVGAADPAAADFGAVLDAHQSASPLLRGIRTMVAHHPDPAVKSFAAHDGHLTAPAFLNGFGLLAERGLSFDAWVYSGQLAEVTALAERFPEVTIVLDHLGTPAGIFGPVGKDTGHTAAQRGALFDRWRDDLTDLAAQPNVVAKVSGLMMPVLGHPVPPRGVPTPVPTLIDRVRPLLTHALTAFGADRLIWGSNFPVDKPITSITGAVETVASVLTDAGASAEDLRKVFGGNAVRVYRIDTTAQR
ncbi:amidohydrolase family protein [Nocardia canadensis]|uniref:amidohydrolase family protein n=1 Tax=Nocardia canadensis TaxID=3065238 RepID=UPI00292FFDBD|nr:amidohydrolase family protein [Nocardia canadensis]